MASRAFMFLCLSLVLVTGAVKLAVPEVVEPATFEAASFLQLEQVPQSAKPRGELISQTQTREEREAQARRAAEKQAAEKRAAEKQAAEKQAAEKQAAEKQAAEKQASEAKEDKCECLAWKDAFESHNADCTLIGGMVCSQFLEKLPNEKFCVNEGQNLKSPQQWCYVSPECESAQASMWKNQSNASVAPFKYCSENERTLGHFKIVKLMEYSIANKLDIGSALGFAYPSLQGENRRVPDVAAYLGLKIPDDAPLKERIAIPMTHEQRVDMQAVADSGKTMFVRSRTEFPPYMVIEGPKAYWINWSVELARAIKANVTEDYFMHRDGNLTSWRVACVAGCENEAPFYTDMNTWFGY